MGYEYDSESDVVPDTDEFEEETIEEVSESYDDTFGNEDY